MKERGDPEGKYNLICICADRRISMRGISAVIFCKNKDAWQCYIARYP